MTAGQALALGWIVLAAVALGLLIVAARARRRWFESEWADGWSDPELENLSEDNSDPNLWLAENPEPWLNPPADPFVLTENGLERVPPPVEPIAHFDARSGVIAGDVSEWKDLSGHGHDLVRGIHWRAPKVTPAPPRIYWRAA